MPCYFCGITARGGLHRDGIGEELASFEEARERAQGLLPDIAREEIPDGEWHSVTCDVRNEAGAAVCRRKLAVEGTTLPLRPSS